MVQNKQSDRNAPDEVHITHYFEAGRKLVFEAWTDPEQLKNWYAPDGCTISFKKIDVRQGGRFHSCIWNPTHGNCWCKGTYLEITAPEKIVFTMQVTDEQGNDVNPADMGMDADWPAVTKVTLTFEEINGRTKLTLHQEVSETLAKATGAHPSWIQMFHRLEELV